MHSRDRQSRRIAARLRAARERANLTQEDLAVRLGLPHRQTLASVEAGTRQLSATELVRAVEVLGVDLEYFTDPFRLVGEGRFSFRATSAVAPSVLDTFEAAAGGWVAAFRELGYQQGGAHSPLAPRLSLNASSSYEEAQSAAERVGEEWGLGDPPADLLPAAVERHLKALVLYVDAPPGISGAAIRVAELNAILVNRNEPEGRRNYDLAHELFHLLTWDLMTPGRIDLGAPAATGRKGRVEQLADNFAAALLMPTALLRSRWISRERSVDPHDWLNTTAAELRVSAIACKWRMRNLGLMSKQLVDGLEDRRLVAHGRTPSDPRTTPRFSRTFVERVARGLDEGRLSARRAASLLALTLPELAELLRSYGFDPPFES